MAPGLASRARVLLVAALLLGGCSAIRIGYNQADTIALWTANDYFDLEPAQRQTFNERFERFHEWHRRTQLPDYVALLGDARARVERGVTREDILWVSDTLKARYRAMVEYTVADMAAILATVSDEQVDYLQKHFREVNRKFAKENWLNDPPEKRRKKIAERFIDRLDHWTGPLSPEQERRITALYGELPPVAQLRHADRMRRQKEFVKLLALRKNTAEFTPKLRHWLLNWEEGRAPEYEKVLSDLVDKNVEFYLALDRLVTREQRQHVAERLQKYADAFRELSQAGKPPSAAAN